MGPTTSPIPNPLSFSRAIDCALTARPVHAHPLNSLDAIAGALLCAFRQFIPPHPPTLRAGLEHPHHPHATPLPHEVTRHSAFHRRAPDDEHAWLRHRRRSPTFHCSVSRRPCFSCLPQLATTTTRLGAVSTSIPLSYSLTHPTRPPSVGLITGLRPLVVDRHRCALLSAARADYYVSTSRRHGRTTKTRDFHAEHRGSASITT